MEILEVLLDAQTSGNSQAAAVSSYCSYSKSSAMTNLFNPKPWSHIIGAKTSTLIHSSRRRSRDEIAFLKNNTCTCSGKEG